MLLYPHGHPLPQRLPYTSTGSPRECHTPGSDKLSNFTFTNTPFLSICTEADGDTKKKYIYKLRKTKQNEKKSKTLAVMAQQEKLLSLDSGIAPRKYCARLMGGHKAAQAFTYFRR